HPFFKAGRLDVSVPRSILGGSVALTRLAADQVRIDLIRRADGSTNLPPLPSGPSGRSLSTFRIDDVALSNVAIAWHDEAHDFTAGTENASLALNRSVEGAEGALTFAQPVVLRLRDQAVRISGNARLAWNGSTLRIESMQLTSPEAGLQ